MAQVVPGIGQGRLFVPEEVKAPELPPDFELDRVVSISHVIKVISDHLDLAPDYSNKQDLVRVEPASIQAGLRFSQQEAMQRRLKTVYRGIGFSATQFLDIARSPSDLASHVYTRTKRANDNRPKEARLNRDELHETASRSAGHTLEGHVLRLTATTGELAQQRLNLLAINGALKAPGRAHWTGRNLDSLRKTASDIFHGHVEIAAGNLGWGDQAADELQFALRYNLYGHAGHNNRRLGYWARYVLMSGLHTRSQLEVTSLALQRAQKELQQYQPYLDAKRQDD